MLLWHEVHWRIRRTVGPGSGSTLSAVAVINVSMAPELLSVLLQRSGSWILPKFRSISNKITPLSAR